MNTITLEYKPRGGSLWADGECLDRAQGICENLTEDIEFKISNILILQAFRIMIVRGKLKAEQLIVKFKNKTLKVNKFATLEDWPKGLGDENINFCGEILRAQMILRNKKHEKTNFYN